MVAAMPSLFHSFFDAPALIARHGLSSLITPDGEMLDLPLEELRSTLRQLPPPLLIHGPATLRLLDLPPEPPPAPWLDLLELFLLIHPARNVTPTARGLALELGLIAPEDTQPLQADSLYEIAQKLLDDLPSRPPHHLATIRLLLPSLKQAGWSWHDIVTQALPPSPDTTPPNRAQEIDALKIWKRLPQWEERAPRPQAASQPVDPQEARKRLATLLGHTAEPRPGQADFASAASYAFAPRDIANAPNIMLAEAGTGTGKTMGYIAPASLWAEKNDGAVWVSTYTRHLQRQIEQELTRLYPDPIERREQAVIRKGRENYLCLLNLEDLTNAWLNRPPHEQHGLIPLIFLALWAEHTQDGDLMGGDLPGWFGELFQRGLLNMLADRRGECIHSACPHYQSCFIEHGIRRAHHAQFVIANHALVLSQAAWNALLPQELAPGNLPDENGIPSRYVFDEGHHIPDAADSAFSLTFSGLETAELRRWILGAEGSRSRARGLLRRMEDLIEALPALKDPFQKLVYATQQGLPRPGWSDRLHEARQNRLNAPIMEAEHEANLDDAAAQQPAEAFLQSLDTHLDARLAEISLQTRGEHGAYARQECDLHPIPPTLKDQTEALLTALQAIVTPLDDILRILREALEDQEELDTAFQQRVEGAIRSLYRRALSRLQGWISMLRSILASSPLSPTLPTFVDFIHREPLPTARFGQEGHDIALNRHWLDPTIPFASTLQSTTHGLLITSATLRDRKADDDEKDGWERAERRLGTTHFLKPPMRASLMSPFDYAHQTRAYIITDLAKGPAAQAQAFQALFEVAHGGALGLFTAINRLKEVHRRIHEPLGMKHIPLYAQHIDAMNNATLVDVFRTETNSCLLGTDAMRDGVDVPGEALRMVVLERTPWPRPDILHRERRRHLSGGRPGDYDDLITRMRLQQAFGRLIRRADDRGVFIILDRRMPSRLLSAFPEGVPIQRLPLAEALEDINGFLNP
ncbi:ATP-dependent DNA helicase [Bombella sp. TMW 2.2558]|uniref:ATP-dependent DNA helicase n=1 Tax=Bombella saccharophila TaxID=2967338 RepID=A0ABT3WAG4_9PROT|nr:ATP-dependent DNA helicase [Bombella saccharophila]MCX5613961.1 ATP-dependent DNA helicase [Bombella saccharophila]